MPYAKPAAVGVDVTKSETAADFAIAMGACLEEGAPWPAAIAVSGGGDSLALMFLLADWAESASRPPPTVLTVDHGLGPEAGQVARRVLDEAKRRGLSAAKLVWRGEKPKSDIEAAARTARYGLMGKWCTAHAMPSLYVAHTLEDQAETFLLRLARGSGLDGLSSMRPVSFFPLPEFEKLRVVRPLLGFTRQELRDELGRRGREWSEDPMNSDTRFARVRVRRAWPLLAELDLTPGRVAAAARHLARARDALEEATSRFLAETCRFEKGAAVFDGARFAAAAPEIGLRAMAEVLSRVSGEAYRPRFECLERLYQSISRGTLKSARTLHGCRVGRAPKAQAVFGTSTLVATREPVRRRPRAGVQIS